MIVARARYLAGAAALAVACFAPTTASAQIIGPCAIFGSPLPPPCIVFDSSKVVQQAMDIKAKADELREMANKAKEMTSIQGALGAVTDKPVTMITSIEPIAPIESVSANDAISSFKASIPVSNGTQSGRATFVGELEKADRGAAGDGWSIAQVAKGRLTNLAEEARKIQAFAACNARRKAAAGGDDNANLRTDWQIRNRAQSLVFQSMALMQEVEAARLNGKAVSMLAMDGPSSAPDMQRSQAPSVPQNTNKKWGQTLATVADYATKLAALYAAKEIMEGFLSAREGQKETQREYQQVLAKAQKAERDLQNLAAREARRKGKSASSLVAVVNQVMAQDRTAWDDPAKGRVTEALAKSAKNRLDKMVKGDAYDSWVKTIIARSDAYKEEAFFRPISKDSKALEDELTKWIASYEGDLGVKASNPAELQKAIAKLEAELAEVGNSMAEAPDDIKRQRDLIYKSTIQIPAPSFDGPGVTVTPGVNTGGDLPPTTNPNPAPNPILDPIRDNPPGDPGRYQDF